MVGCPLSGPFLARRHVPQPDRRHKPRSQRLAVRAIGQFTPSCPSRVARSCRSPRPTVDRPVRTAEARVLPSGLKATEVTSSVCPLRVFVACWADSGDVATSDNQATPSHAIGRRIRPAFGFIADLSLPRPSYLVRTTPQSQFYPFPTRLTLLEKSLCYQWHL
jgi:hypothetical protein